MANNLNIDGRNEMRPYNVALSEHDENIASIILLTREDKDKAIDEDGVVSNYLTNFDKPIQEITVPNYDGGNIVSETGSSAPAPEETRKIKVFEGKEALDGNNKYYGIFNNFSLINVAESREQLIKLHQNFGGSWNVFFFGDRPRVYSFTGFFIDSKEYPYYQEFLVAYDKYIAGRKCIENNLEMMLSYSGKIIEGYLLDMQTSHTSNQPYMKNFSFTVLVKNEKWFRNNFLFNPFNGLLTPDLNALSNEYRIDSLGKPDVVDN